MVIRFLKATDPSSWFENRALVVEAVASGFSVVIPTDTVYGIACDPKAPEAVRNLLATKGRDRNKPTPVLVGSPNDLVGLVEVIPDSVRPILSNFWPGAVTLVFRAHPDLGWDLGETQGTVALRMPNHKITLEILRETGPLAVSSANISGNQAASSVDEAYEQLGERVHLYVDAGPVGREYQANGRSRGSTIVDVTRVASGGFFKVMRKGDVDWQELREIAGGDWA
mgnify:CR=1 FL=1